MFKAHILVAPNSDLEVEIAKIQGLAQKHRLRDDKIDPLIQNAKSLLGELRRSAIDAKSSGFTLDIKKTLEDIDYQITLEVSQMHSKPGKSLNVFSWLRGR